MNKVILLGRVGQKPELTTLTNGNVCKFSLATNETYKDKQGQKVTNTEWHNIVVFGKQADVINQYVDKGKQLLVEGKIKTDSWDDNDGNKKYKTNVVMTSFNFVSGSDNTNSQQMTPQQAVNAINDAMPPEDNDDLPF